MPQTNAIYLDFECLGTRPPRPILLGILKDMRREQHFEQVILDHTLKGAAVAARHLRYARFEEAAQALVAEAEANDCSLVGWSFFDRDVLLNCGMRKPLEEVVRRRYVNALETARPWKTKIYPEVKIARAGKFAPKNTLDKFAELAGYPHVDVLRSAEPAKWIRDVQKALKRTAHYSRIKTTAKEKWRALLDYNEHDCRAARHVSLKASFELRKWREYERTEYCVQPDHGGRIRFRVGSIDKKRDALLDRLGVSRWAFITAWNPSSQQLSPAENARRQSELRAAVNAAGYHCLPGEGIGEDRTWAPEESLFVMGILKSDARRFGRKFGQLAIVVGHKNFRARLIRC